MKNVIKNTKQRLGEMTQVYYNLTKVLSLNPIFNMQQR